MKSMFIRMILLGILMASGCRRSKFSAWNALVESRDAFDSERSFPEDPLAHENLRRKYVDPQNSLLQLFHLHGMPEFGGLYDDLDKMNEDELLYFFALSGFEKCRQNHAFCRPWVDVFRPYEQRMKARLAGLQSPVLAWLITHDPVYESHFHDIHEWGVNVLSNHHAFRADSPQNIALLLDACAVGVGGEGLIEKSLQEEQLFHCIVDLAGDARHALHLALCLASESRRTRHRFYDHLREFLGSPFAYDKMRYSMDYAVGGQFWFITYDKIKNRGLKGLPIPLDPPSNDCR